jgi:predicted MPP superfamily phosphohydrolase
VDEFKDRKHFPGTKGGPFEVLVRKGMSIEQIPAPIFALGLMGWSYVIAWGEFPEALIFYGFATLDWALIRILPIVGFSFGPIKPPVLMLAILRTPFLFFPPPYNWTFQSIGTLLVIYAFWFEPQRLTVSHESLATDKLPKGARIRLLHFGDLHIERITPRDQKLVKKINQLKADLILFSGDLLSYSNLDDPNSWTDTRWVFDQLKAKHGIYAVRGSPAVDEDYVVDAIYEGINVNLLENEVAEVKLDDGTVTILGLSCSHKPHIDGVNLKSLTALNENSFRILLYHSPDLAPLAAQDSVNLQLSGHTHGGQVRLPVFGALFAASLYGKRFEMGRYKVDEMILYVTRGLGMEGMAAPRVRFLSPPEIVIWEVCGI